MRFRKVRIAVTGLSLTACVLLTALWVRSYTTVDFWMGFPHGGKIVNAASIQGQLEISVVSFAVAPGRQPNFGLRSERLTMPVPRARSWTGMKWLNGGVFGLWLPHWLPVLVTAVFAIAPWLQWWKRFSLRTLLIAMTLVAVVLALVVYAGRTH